MRIGGIVAEYNPFHSGHAALCAAARAAGCTHIVAAMSGNFVQRADFAVTEKRVRAACALRAGVDLVLELPTAWATATAQVFARGGAGLLAACGCVDVLAFGSECGDGALLREAAQAVDHPEVEARLRGLLAGGITYAKAREQAVREVLGGGLAMPLASPNDLLGVEYLRQAAALGWGPELFVLPRRGAGHDSGAPAGGFASASWLRAQAGDLRKLERYMPGPCAEQLRAAKADRLFPVDRRALEPAILAKLRAMPREEFARLPDLSEGLENRFYTAVRSSCSVAELEAALKTKRYTMARVRRLILSAFLGIQKGDAAGIPPYLRVLGFNAAGKELLARMGKSATLPVGTSLVRLAERGDRARRTAELEARGTDLYTLALPRPLPCGYDLTGSVVRG